MGCVAYTLAPYSVSLPHCLIILPIAFVPFLSISAFDQLPLFHCCFSEFLFLTIKLIHSISKTLTEIMRLPTSLYAATLALTANAVLLPPDVSAEPAISIVASKQTIKLDCERCNIAVDNGNWEKGTHGYVGPTGTNKNDLKMGIEMGFSIENKQVALNGVPFYPIKAPGIVPRLSAKQVVSDEINNRVPVYRGELPLSTNIEIQPPTEMRGNNGNLKVHRICLEVIGMADNPVYVPTVQLKVAELPSGEVVTPSF